MLLKGVRACDDGACLDYCAEWGSFSLKQRRGGSSEIRKAAENVLCVLCSGEKKERVQLPPSHLSQHLCFIPHVATFAYAMVVSAAPAHPRALFFAAV